MDADIVVGGGQAKAGSRLMRPLIALELTRDHESIPLPSRE